MVDMVVIIREDGVLLIMVIIKGMIVSMHYLICIVADNA